LTRRPGRKYQDYNIEVVEVPRENPEADQEAVLRLLAGLIARNFVATPRKLAKEKKNERKDNLNDTL